MTSEELSDLSAIRERLRAIERRLDEFERTANTRADRLDTELRELVKTVTRLSEIVANTATRLSAGLPIAVSGSATGGAVALVAYYALRALGV